MSRCRLILPVFLSVLANAAWIAPATARTWYVNANGSGDMPTIQAAIDTAGVGDVILVGPGRYSWTSQGTGEEAGMIRFMERDIYLTLRSEMGAGVTTLDAEYQSRVIYCHGMNHVTVEGFTITGGEAPEFGDQVGGGFFTHIPAEVVRDCVFVANRALHGGGISCVINDRSFAAQNCVFINNTAYNSGGAISLWNGTGTISITGCVMDGNTAAERGGAIFAYNCTAGVAECVFYGNSAGSGGSAFCGYDGGNLDMIASTICDDSGGEAVFRAYGSSRVDIFRSVAAFNNGILFDLAEGTTGGIGCCDIFGNDGGDALPALLADEGTNISADPLFCGSVDSRNYQLRSDSPCFPGNIPDGPFCSIIGAFGIGCSSVATESSSWGAIKTLFH